MGRCRSRADLHRICWTTFNSGMWCASQGPRAQGRSIRSHPAIVARGVRVNIEADSLNAAILGPDAEASGATFDFFVREVVREMTVEGRAEVHGDSTHSGSCRHKLERPSDAIRAQLEQVNVGDPAECECDDGAFGEHDSSGPP